VEQDGLAFQFAAKALRSDPHIVQQAVAQNGVALRFAADGIRSDPATGAFSLFFLSFFSSFYSGTLPDRSSPPWGCGIP
jgi:hypothetical protein